MGTITIESTTPTPPGTRHWATRTTISRRIQPEGTASGLDTILFESGIATLAEAHESNGTTHARWHIHPGQDGTTPWDRLKHLLDANPLYRGTLPEPPAGHTHDTLLTIDLTW